MRIILISGLIIVLGYSCTKEEEPGYEDIQTLVSTTVNNAQIPGMIAAIIDSAGILDIAVDGIRKTGSPEAISVNDHFHLGSCTKAMTSVLTGMLIEAEELEFETSIIEVFPELLDSIHRDYHQITLHQLLTHRGGIYDDVIIEKVFDDPDIAVRRYKYMKEILKIPSEYGPGEYHYSNIGYVIAGAMLERITGSSWEDFISERLFAPLGMVSTGFGTPGTAGGTDQPWGHYRNESGWVSSQWDNPEEVGPAGTVHSSFEDWTKFLSLFLTRDDTPVLGRQLLNELIDPVDDYACGWVVYPKDWASGTVLSHNGSNSMWYVSVWLAPEINRGYIVGTNSRDANSNYICDQVLGWLVAIDQEN